MLNTYTVVMYVQGSHHFCNIDTTDDDTRPRRKYKETN